MSIRTGTNRSRVARHARILKRVTGLLTVAYPAVLLVFTPSVAPAGWEYAGSKAEIFDLHQYVMTADPEGIASCTDAYGGLIVAAYDAEASPSQIFVSRVAHDGTELWGQGGVPVPREIGTLGHHSPVAVAPDAAGGAYVAYICIWPSYELFRITHFNAAGTWDRTVSVDNPGTVGVYDHLSIKLVPLANGDVIAVWTQRVPSTKLHAARFNTAGTRLWHTDVNQNYSHRETVVANTQTSWYVASDMLDGMHGIFRRVPSFGILAMFLLCRIC